MESSNLNNSLPEDDGLDAQLRAHLSAPPLADNGFSQRVLVALPMSERTSFLFSRQFFCVTGLVAGTLCAAIGLIGSETLESTLKTLDMTVTIAVDQLVTRPVVLAVGLAILSLAFAFRDPGRRLTRL